MEQLKGSHEEEHPDKRLGATLATAICGNDILSSTFYASSISIIFAGVYAPLVLLLIAAVLFLYRKVYIEVVEALPNNGGAYNCLLNGTAKHFAVVAGVITILSYIATAVLSAKTGIAYLDSILAVPVIPLTVLLLGIFAVLVLKGIHDSAKVALAIFAIHIITLTVFLLLGALHYMHGGSSFAVNATRTAEIAGSDGGILAMIFFGFSVSLLGVSGFESSANFVEEQRKGVFRKTLKNMLIVVAIFNPLVCMVALNTMPYDAIVASKDFLLADAAGVLGGPLFSNWMVIDALLVLAGAVLTAYIGVSGLAHRMATDECLPSFFTRKNRRGAYPAIIISFFLLCSSILLVTGGSLLSMAAVYTISFLGVMSLFAFGNLLLRRTRRYLKRTYTAPTYVVVLALFATLAGMVGNVVANPKNLFYFSVYFFPFLGLMLCMVYRRRLLTFLLPRTLNMPSLNEFFERAFKRTTEQGLVVFVRDARWVRQTFDYIEKNESARNITFVYCSDEEAHLDHTYMAIKKAIERLKLTWLDKGFRISIAHMKRPFGPDAIDAAARELRVPRNRIFMGCIDAHHCFDYSEISGVRIIH